MLLHLRRHERRQLPAATSQVQLLQGEPCPAPAVLRGRDLPAQAWGLEGICVHRSANTGKRGASGAPSLYSPLPKQGFSLASPPCAVSWLHS